MVVMQWSSIGKMPINVFITAQFFLCMRNACVITDLVIFSATRHCFSKRFPNIHRNSLENTGAALFSHKCAAETMKTERHAINKPLGLLWGYSRFNGSCMLRALAHAETIHLDVCIFHFSLLFMLQAYMHIQSQLLITRGNAESLEQLVYIFLLLELKHVNIKLGSH